MLGITALLVLPGCGGSKFELVPVTGIVKMDGKPLANAVVSFQPHAAEDSMDSGPGSSGVSDESGKFTLATQTPERDPGAVPGKHTIRISMKTGARGKAIEEPTDIASDEDAQPVFEGIPMKYNLKSELTFQVPAEGTDAANFDLKTK